MFQFPNSFLGVNIWMKKNCTRTKALWTWKTSAFGAVLAILVLDVTFKRSLIYIKRRVEGKNKDFQHVCKLLCLSMYYSLVCHFYVYCPSLGRWRKIFNSFLYKRTTWGKALEILPTCCWVYLSALKAWKGLMLNCIHWGNWYFSIHLSGQSANCCKPSVSIPGGLFLSFIIKHSRIGEGEKPQNKIATVIVTVVYALKHERVTLYNDFFRLFKIISLFHLLVISTTFCSVHHNNCRMNRLLLYTASPKHGSFFVNQIDNTNETETTKHTKRKAEGSPILLIVKYPGVMLFFEFWEPF